MSAVQRYISDELTHFVGSKKRKSKTRSREDGQYELLIKILNEGRLYNPKMGVSLAVYTSAEISKNEMYSPQSVCLSDIPIEDLKIHTKKYSGFGVSFTKDFIIKQKGVPIDIRLGLQVLPI